jgi:glutamate racemase
VSTSRPVGIFDSGIGGLSVLREIRRELPFEGLVYVADSGHAPYGDRDPAFIRNRAVTIAVFLEGQGAKAIVVACNTATGVAVEALRARFTLPIVAIEPAVKPAASRTRSGIVGVMATTQTLSSLRFAKLVEAHAADVQVIGQPCPGLVEQVEAGELATPETRELVERYVRPLVEKGADTIVLGCTHFPFLVDVIRNVAGPHVTIIDPAVAVARELRRRLDAHGLAAAPERPGGDTFWTTGAPEGMRRALGQLGMSTADVRRVPAEPCIQ